MAKTLFAATLLCALTLFSGLASSTNQARHRTLFRSKRNTLPALRFKYGTDKIRGVNLGGWLVLESWITPSLFAATNDGNIVDEFTFGQLQDPSVAKAALTEHWNTWITEDDFAAIAAAGLNHVRIPIGYWAFDVSGGEPYIQGQYPVLKTAVGWAQTHELKVIIDLHGAPDSQNGFDNSGHEGPALWHTETSNVHRTIAIMNLLAAEFSKPQYANVVTAIEALNEPAGFMSADLVAVTTQYYNDAYGNVRFPFGNSTEGPLLFIIHDAFLDLTHWNGFMAGPDHQAVMMDTHYYQMFDPSQIPNTPAQHIANMCNRGTEIAAFKTLWTVVGEWTAPTSDCTNSKKINPNGSGSRYDGTFPGSTAVGSCIGMTGDSATFTSDFKSYLRQTFEAQTSSFEKGGQGWIFWAWKTETVDEWSYKKGLAGGWIPQDPTERKFPNICGSKPPTATTATMTHSSATPKPSTHIIHPGASNTKCVTAANNKNGGAVTLQDCDGTASQAWTQSGGTFVIYTNKCLDVTNGSTSNGNLMQIWTCTSKDVNQQFSATDDNRIPWSGMHGCMDLTDGKTANGTPIQMWHCTANDNNQVWNIV